MDRNAIVDAQGLVKASEELYDVSIRLYQSYENAKAYIIAIHKAGWNDAHFKDLQVEFDKANEFILPLRKFMIRSKQFQDQQKVIVENYKNTSFPKLK